LAEAAAHPTEGSAVEERDGRRRSSTRTERWISTLSVPLRMKTGDARRKARRRRDTGPSAGHTRGVCGARWLTKHQRACYEEDTSDTREQSETHHLG